MAILQDRIKKRRTSMGLTLLEVAEQLGVKEATVQRYESGEIKNIKHETIVNLARVLECSPAYLMGWEESSAVPLAADHVFQCPVYDSAAAGFNTLAQDTIIGYIPAYIPSPSERELYIYVRVIGDSMSPLIDSGDRVLVRRQTSVDSGQIAIVIIDGEEAVVKKVIYGDQWIELHSVNPYYPPRRFEGAAVQKVFVFGLVKEINKVLQ